uniref:Uncharacterized protein n=1 Tax=Heterorhabditis bacteriophora TaxID=37862 RepID=A0A1I7W6M0_HETBA
MTKSQPARNARIWYVLLEYLPSTIFLDYVLITIITIKYSQIMLLRVITELN